jgi:hypothetical protein
LVRAFAGFWEKNLTRIKTDWTDKADFRMELATFFFNLRVLWEGLSQGYWLDQLAVEKRDLRGLWWVVVLCGCFLVLLGLLLVCIGIYRVSWSAFLRAKRGEIVVNCVVDVDTRMVAEVWLRE